MGAENENGGGGIPVSSGGVDLAQFNFNSNPGDAEAYAERAESGHAEIVEKIAKKNNRFVKEARGEEPDPEDADTDEGEELENDEDLEEGEDGEEDEEEETEEKQPGKSKVSDKAKRRQEAIVNSEEYKRAQTALDEANRERATLRQEIQETNEAAALGYTKDQYKQVKLEASSNGFADDVVGYLTAVQTQRETDQRIAQIQQDEELNDRVRAYMIQSEKNNLQTQTNLLRQQSQTKSSQIKEANSRVDVFMKDTGVTELPSYIDTILRTTDPAMLDKLIPDLKKIMGKLETDTKVKEAEKREEKKQRRAARPSPEGRGGTAVVNRNVNPKQSMKDIGRSSWNSLVGRPKNYG